MKRIKNNNYHHSTNAGFTIIELMMATVIFSLVLVVILASFLQIGRMFYKGVSINSTNEAARTVVDSIADDVRLSKGGFIPGGSNYFCVGLHRYTFGVGGNRKLTSTDVSNPSFINPKGVIVSTIPGGGCNVNGTDARQLLGPDMQLNNLTMSCNSNVSCTVHIHVIFYGFDDSIFISRGNITLTPAQAINSPDAECSGSLLSTQFCATADLQTTIALGF